jgi:hypothetical protein
MNKLRDDQIIDLERGLLEKGTVLHVEPTPLYAKSFRKKLMTLSLFEIGVYESIVCKLSGRGMPHFNFMVIVNRPGEAFNERAYKELLMMPGGNPNGIIHVWGEE